jgi:hypothetical protein
MHEHIGTGGRIPQSDHRGIRGTAFLELGDTSLCYGRVVSVRRALLVHGKSEPANLETLKLSRHKL